MRTEGPAREARSARGEAGGDTSVGEDGGTGDEGAEGTADGVDDGGDEGDTGSAGLVPARGISITKVTANQGVQVPIAIGGTWADGEVRNAQLAPNRDTLIRVFHTVEAGWTARELIARLTIEFADGQTVVKEQAATIQGDSNDNGIDTGFYWGLVADEGETANGVKFQVELLEPAGAGDGFSEAVTITPPERDFIGFESAEMDLKVVFVPVTYSNGTTPDPTPESVKTTFEREIFQMNPLTTLTTDVREPISYTQSLGGGNGNLGNLLPVMDQLRAQDGAASNVYYSALVQTGQNSGVLGIAYLGGLVNANIWQANSIKMTSITTTHEIGHNQGLQHIGCPGGQSQGNDPSYPYANGTIGEAIGFGIRDFTVYPSSAYNYMSYCFQLMWVSDWTWQKVWSRIYDFSAQGDEGLPEVDVIRTQLNPDGTEIWWRSRDVIDLERLSGNYTIEFLDNGEVVDQSLGMVGELSEGGGIWVTAPVPDADFDTIRRVEDTLTVEVPADEMDAYRVRDDLR